MENEGIYHQSPKSFSSFSVKVVLIFKDLNLDKTLFLHKIKYYRDFL